MGGSLYLVVSNIYMEHFLEFARDTVKHKLSLWITCLWCP